MSSIFNGNSRGASFVTAAEVVETAGDDSSLIAAPKNLAQWVGNELVKELERELACVKSKLEKSRRKRGSHDDDDEEQGGDAMQLIHSLMDEMAKIGADIAALQEEQERLKKISSRSARGELKARLDAAVRENLDLRKRREELNNLLNLLLVEQSDLAACNSTKQDHNDHKDHKAGPKELKGQLSDLKKQIAEVRLNTPNTVIATTTGESSRFDSEQVQQSGKDKFNLKVRLNENTVQDMQLGYNNEKLEFSEGKEEPLQRRVEDLEMEIARLKSELLFIRSSLGRLNSRTI